MKPAHPDIVVVNPDGEYLIIVEVNSKSHLSDLAIDQLKYLMAAMGCSVGLVVAGDRIFLLRDSLEKYHGESITVIGQARLPDYLHPPTDEKWRGKHRLEFEFEFESRVQQWLEQLKQMPNLETLPSDLKELLGNPVIMSLLRFGEIRAAGPRWRRMQVEA